MTCTPPSLTSPFGSLQLPFLLALALGERESKELQRLVAGVQPPPCSSLLISRVSSSTSITLQPPLGCFPFAQSLHMRGQLCTTPLAASPGSSAGNTGRSCQPVRLLW